MVRQTKNYQSNGPVTDVTSMDMRCYQMKDAAGVLNVTAGSTLAYHAKASISHPGPMSAYIAKVPAGQSVMDWTADGKVWSKIYGDKPNLSPAGMTWPSQGKCAKGGMLSPKRVQVKGPDLTPSARCRIR